MSVSIAAIVHPTAHLHPTVQVYAGATVGAFASIGKGCIIGHGATVGEGAQVGAGVWVYNHATVGKGCVVGDRQRIREGWVLPDATEIPQRDKSPYYEIELPPLPELDMRPVVRAAESLQEVFAHHILMGYDLAALEMRAAQYAARRGPAVPKWGGIVNPATNRHLNPDAPKPNTKKFAKTWNPGAGGYLMP